MDINEISERKAELERQIASDVAKRIEAFKADTGLTPSSVYINMINASQTGQRRRQYAVAGCEASIEI